MSSLNFPLALEYQGTLRKAINSIFAALPTNFPLVYRRAAESADRVENKSVVSTSAVQVPRPCIGLLTELQIEIDATVGVVLLD